MYSKLIQKIVVTGFISPLLSAVTVLCS